MSPDCTGGQPRILIDVERSDGTTEHVESAMHSYVDNWYTFVLMTLDFAFDETVTDTAGTSRTISTNSSSNRFSDTNYSLEIVIGSDSSGFDQTDNSIGTAINTSGVSSRTVDTGDQLIRVSASFSIGSSDTIRETVLQLGGVNSTSNNTFDLAIERTVLDSAVSISNGDTVSVTYELVWNVP